VADRDLTSLVAALLAGDVDFVLVGALAAVAQGAPLTTHDVDIVHARTPQNLDRLIAVLIALHARHRGRASGEVLPPDRRALATVGHSLFMTDLGPLDCLGAIENGQTYDDLLPHAIEVELDGRRLRLLDLETIVALKRASTHPKDRLALPVLEETLRRRGRVR
jgi:predicted nucleotidyltransferase